MEAFVQQLKQDSFKYETGSERKLAELEQIVQREKYDQLVGDQIETLKSLLKNDLDKDVATFEDEILDLLSEEIISRYYYQKGRIAFFLRTDPVILKAVEVLNNPSEYQDVLGVQPLAN